MPLRHATLFTMDALFRFGMIHISSICLPELTYRAQTGFIASQMT
jgi:hypothetical protein